LGERLPFTYRFSWDPAKAASNQAKHGISFEVAAIVMRDPLALSRYDEEGHAPTHCE
jgi:hypothetical protein